MKTQIAYTEGGIAALEIAADLLATSTKVWSGPDLAEWLRGLATDQRDELMKLGAGAADRLTLEALLREALPSCPPDLRVRIEAALNAPHAANPLRIVPTEEP